ALGSASAYEAGERPAFAAIIYGAGADTPIPDDAPPLFIVAAADDPVVPASGAVRLYSRWHEAGRSAELHVYGQGGHGFGMLEQGLPSDGWIEAFHAWLLGRGILAEAGDD